MAKPNYMAYGGRGYDTKERFYNAEEGLKMKHTAGPWKVSNYRPNQVIARDPKESTYEIGDDKFCPLAMVPEIADAHLIASAPELLEALKNIIADDEMRDGDLPQELVNMAKAVIFKAEGRS